ncbi:MAG: CHAT domain-containing protein [Gammaproteobacteria bacterium]|nr:CHAT domain-containing protein [Gammaproteobacteria bacterium]
MNKTILILAANPGDTARLRLDTEVREIDKGLKQASQRDNFVLKHQPAVRIQDLQQAMLDYKPNLVHFCGHGEGAEGIVLENEHGNSALVSTEALAEFFELFAGHVECVLLNACYSEMQAAAIARHIPHVVGMSQAISDEAALTFSIAFYKALGAGQAIQFAYKLACNAIKMAGIAEHLTPRLHGSQQNSIDKDELIRTARRLERNRTFPDALEHWRDIQQIDPDDPEPAHKIKRLQAKIKHSERAAEAKKQFSKRKKEIKAVYFQVSKLLKRIEKAELDEDESEDILETVEEFLSGNSDATDFMEYWDAPAKPAGSGELKYNALADRLRRGEIVIMLGPDSSCAFARELPGSDALAPHLAESAAFEDDEFRGSLPEICEYFKIDTQLGHNSLCLKLQEILKPPRPVSIALYRMLAEMSVPLILVSAIYDELLEENFKAAGKPYVLVSHHTKKIGSLFLEYSDDTPAAIIGLEEFSRLRVLEKGYSLIYKILGCFELKNAGETNIKDSLLLSEQDYFRFARHTDKLIPPYLVRELSGKGFWLLGYYPKSWEQRLLAEALLDKREHEEQAFTVQQNAGRFARVYWESRGVKNHPVGLKEFVEGLMENL